MKTIIQQCLIPASLTLLLNCAAPTSPTTTPPTNGTPANTTGLPATSGTGPVGTGVTQNTGSGTPQPVNQGGTTQASLTELVTAAGDNGTLGSATVTGSVNNYSLSPTGAFFDAMGADNTGVLYVGLLISNNSQACASLVNDSNFNANSTYMISYMFALDASGNNLALTTGNFTAIDPNTNTAPAGSYMTSMFEAVNGQCGPLLPGTSQAAESGTFNLTALNVGANAVPNSLTGTFSFDIGSNNAPLKGSVTAAPCPGMLAILLNAQSVIGCQ